MVTLNSLLPWSVSWLNHVMPPPWPWRDICPVRTHVANKWPQRCHAMHTMHTRTQCTTHARNTHTHTHVQIEANRSWVSESLHQQTHTHCSWRRSQASSKLGSLFTYRFITANLNTNTKLCTSNLLPLWNMQLRSNSQFGSEANENNESHSSQANTPPGTNLAQSFILCRWRVRENVLWFQWRPVLKTVSPVNTADTGELLRRRRRCSLNNRWRAWDHR